MSQLISRPVDASEYSVKRSASVPCAEMPSANALRVRFSIFLCQLGLHHVARAFFDKVFKINAIDHIERV
jgi:hypothetical protein